MKKKAEWNDFEEKARKYFESFLKMSLVCNSVEIEGKGKKFDLVNKENKVVGDVKFYKNTIGGNIPSAKRSTLNEYVWLMQKLGNSWRKIIVIGEDKEMAQKYVNDFGLWLGNVEVWFFTRKRNNAEKLR